MGGGPRQLVYKIWSVNDVMVRNELVPLVQDRCAWTMNASADDVEALERGGTPLLL